MKFLKYLEYIADAAYKLVECIDEINDHLQSIDFELREIRQNQEVIKNDRNSY